MPRKFPCLGQKKLKYNATYPCPKGFLQAFIKLRSHSCNKKNTLKLFSVKRARRRIYNLCLPPHHPSSLLHPLPQSILSGLSSLPIVQFSSSRNCAADPIASHISPYTCYGYRTQPLNKPSHPSAMWIPSLAPLHFSLSTIRTRFPPSPIGLSV